MNIGYLFDLENTSNNAVSKPMENPMPKKQFERRCMATSNKIFGKSKQFLSSYWYQHVCGGHANV